MKHFVSFGAVIVFVVLILLAPVAPTYGQSSSVELLTISSQLDFGSVELPPHGFASPKHMTLSIKNTSGFSVRPFYTKEPGGVFSVDRIPEQSFSISDFSRTDNVILAPGQELRIMVTFKPRNVGTYNDVLFVGAEIVRDFVATPVSSFTKIVSFFGRAIEPGISLNANVLDFGAVQAVQFNDSNARSLKGQAQQLGFTVTNTSETALRGVLTFSSDAFFLTNVSSISFRLSQQGQERTFQQHFSLAPHTSQEVMIGFLPPSGGPFTATVIVDSNAAKTRNDRLTLELRGVGLAPELSPNTTSLDFGKLNVGDSLNKTLTLKNTGNETLTVQVESFCSEFSLSVTQATVVSPGQSLNVVVVFRPTRGGVYACALLVHSDDSDNASARILVTGNATRARQSSFSLPQAALELRPLGSGFQLDLGGANVASLQLHVFDLRGQLVFASGVVSGNRLSWQALNNEGVPLANGVYLYVVTASGNDGQHLRSAVKKLVVLN